ncbi:MAG TPA: hypothetical protein DCQ93_10095 [Bacteroidetes bacterium]|nr:hypothetical protein [Bacteroidota bacterium]
MIPLSVPNLGGNEWKYIKDCLDTNWVSSVGSYVDRFEKSLAEFTGAKHAVATVNGTAALHISLLLAGVGQGDLVIAPNITFIASINSITYCGANPVLIDIDERTWQMDLNLLEEFLKKETSIRSKKCFHEKSGRRISAIMPVHVLGNMCDMSRLMTLAKKYFLAIVEDATEALGSSYKQKHAGTFGLFGSLSFNGNKILTTGGGGMILTNNSSLAKKAKHLTTQAKADAFEYYHDESGFNYRLVNVLAAMGCAQMEQLPDFLKKKYEIKNLYSKNFSSIKEISEQQVEKNVTANNWLYTIHVPDKKKFLDYLNQNGFQSRPFWVPMNQLPMFKKEIYYQQENISAKIYNHCASIPCSTNLKKSGQLQVINAVKKFFS